MNWLLLRGEVPQDRSPQEIVFNTIEEVDDTWSQLFFAMIKPEDQAELWYWGGNREHKFAENFTERWVPNFATYKSDFIPDVIFCRGGFKEYHPVLKRFPNAFKIRYGAGRRFLPCQGFYDYDLLLQDSKEQLRICKQKFPHIPCSLFIKPAADSLFYPIDGIEKEYDVCFPANGMTVRKGHDFIYHTLPKDISVLNLGFPSSRAAKPDNVVSYPVIKSEMNKHIQKCKVGIIASTLQGTMSWDSCPRTLPELLSCGLPVVVLDELEFWAEKYITPMTGKLASRSNYWETVQDVLDGCDKYSARKYYEDNLSVKHAAKFLREKINVHSV